MIKRLRERAYRLLRSSERYTKTDMVYLAKGGFWLTFGNFAASGLSFIMAIVFANKVLPDVYGTYKFILSTLGILSITTLTGMGGILSQAVSRGIEGSFFKAFRTKIVWGLFGAAAGIGLAVYYYVNGNTELAIAFIVAAAFVPFMDSFTIYQDYLNGKKLFSVYSVCASISQTVATILMIGTVFLTSNLFAILLTYLCSWTLMRGLFFLRTARKYPPNDKVDPNTISYGKHTSYIDIIATLVGSVDQILIFHFLGATELALYTFAMAPVIQLVSVFRNIPVLAMPKMAARPVPEIHGMLKKRILGAVGVAAAITAVYAIFTPLLYHIFFPKYIGSIPLSRLYALTMLISIPLTIVSPAINAKVNYIPKKMLYIWVLPGLISTLFILATIQFVGVSSVIYARILLLVVTATISACFWIYIRKKDRMDGPVPPGAAAADEVAETSHAAVEGATSDIPPESR